VPSLAGTPHVRISRDGGRTYPARHAGPLPADPPEAHPCTIPVFDPASGTGRRLALDLDPGALLSNTPVKRTAPGAMDVTPGCDSASDVEHQAAELGQLLKRLGGRYLADVAPSGGRHVYAVFSAALPWLELRDLARAIALRFPAVDVAPMSSLGGQISPPGSRHKSGGWRLLTTSLEDARAAAERPNGPEVWAGLLTEFAAELQLIETRHAVADSTPPTAEQDDSGVPWVPRLGGRAPLAAELEHAARTGRWDHSRYADRSAARMAVLASCAARGWQLPEVRAAIDSGAWRGLADLYHRVSEPGRMDRLLPYEWRKTIAFVSGEKNVRHWHTSDVKSRPPADPDGADQFRLIRQWMTMILCAAEDPERVRGWGRRAIAIRLVLLALGQAAMASGSSTIEFGCRNLSLHAALSHRTVARVLRQLANEPDPLIDLVSCRQMARADRYQLRIPDRYADSVRWRRLRAGRIDAIHPVFLVLGGTAGLVYQVLSAEAVRGAEVARMARLPASTTSDALRRLAEHGLAERGPGGWRRGPVALADVAESTGAADVQRERAERYRQDRESWRARLRQYAGARVDPRDGWLSLDDGDEYDELSRWPVLSDDFVRGPPTATRARESA
jgi:hypothetical protein